MGSAWDPTLAPEIAAAGGRVMTAVGPTTSLLVIASKRPFDYGIQRSANLVRAERLIASGKNLRIISSEELRGEILSRIV